jgi:hypothetical protein
MARAFSCVASYRKDVVTHLIRHYHELPISQAAHIRIVFVVLKTHNLLDILDLLILHNLVVFRLAHVKKLAA